MAGAREDVMLSLLGTIDTKQEISNPDDNTILQKGVYPTETMTLSDTVTTTVTPLTSLVYGGMVTFGAEQYQRVVLADRPVGYWRLDEASGTVAHDISGNANPGTITGGVTLGQQGALASTDTAMEFDGSTGYIVAPHQAVLDCPSAVTMEAWVKPGIPSTTNGGDWINKGENSGYRIRVNQDLTVAMFAYSNGNALGTTQALSQSAYTHVVGVGDSNGLRIYFNGVEVASNTIPYDVTDTVAGLLLGTYSPDLEMYPGSLDEVAIYPYALTAQQVAAHYDAASWRVATLTQTDALARIGSVCLANTAGVYYASGTAQTPTIDLSPAAAIPGATCTVFIDENLPTSAVTATCQVRFSTDGATWGAWQAVTNGQTLAVIERYAQALVSLATTDTTQTPQVNGLKFSIATPAKWCQGQWQ